jgi:hypothetical protein
MENKESIQSNEEEKIEPEQAEAQNETSSANKNDDDKAEHKKKKTKTFFTAPLVFILIIIMFGLSFRFQAISGEIGPINDIENLKIKSLFEQYYLFAGLIFGLLSALLFLILNIVFKKILKYAYYTKYLVVSLSILPWYFFARQLVFNEGRFADYAKAIISYIGYPLLATTKFLFLLLIILFIVNTIWKFKNLKSLAKIIIILVLPISLSGCLGGMAGLTCYLLPDSDHCFQAAAMQENDPEGCKKIKGKDFEGSNPPRDKCYLKIAKNTGDLSVCDSIEGGMFSYTKEECYLETSIEHVNPSGCMKLSGSDKEACVNSMSSKISSGSVLEIDEQIDFLKKELKDKPDKDLEMQLAGLEQKKQDYLAVMSEENKKDYEESSDPLNIAAKMDFYAGRIDQKSKDSLIALNNSLREKGNPMSEKEYQAIRDVLAYKNDPKNNIENMDDNEIVKLRWNEKLGNAKEFFKFWKANKTSTEEKYDEQLLFYQRMLERQEAIDKGLNQKQQDIARETDRVTGYIKDEITNALIEEGKKQAFGELLDLVDSDAAGPTTAILGEAIDVVKSEAKAKEFRGLVRAYNKGMEEELSKTGGDVEKAHAAVVATMQNNAYAYEDQNTLAKYGNLLENSECDGKNPHCLKKDIFWKAMKKSFKYQQGKTK